MFFKTQYFQYYHVNLDYHDSERINKSCLFSNPHQFSRTNTFCFENENFKKVTFAKDLSMHRASNMQHKRHQMCDQNFIE